MTLCVCVYARKTPESSSLGVLFMRQFRLNYLISVAFVRVIKLYLLSKGRNYHVGRTEILDCHLDEGTRTNC